MKKAILIFFLLFSIAYANIYEKAEYEKLCFIIEEHFKEDKNSAGNYKTKFNNLTYWQQYFFLEDFLYPLLQIDKKKQSSLLITSIDFLSSANVYGIDGSLNYLQNIKKESEKLETILMEILQKDRKEKLKREKRIEKNKAKQNQSFWDKIF